MALLHSMGLQIRCLSIWLTASGTSVYLLCTCFRSGLDVLYASNHSSGTCPATSVSNEKGMG